MPEIKIREAKNDDSGFIKKIIQEGIRDGHFLDTSKIKGLRNIPSIIDMIDNIIKKRNDRRYGPFARNYIL